MKPLLGLALCSLVFTCGCRQERPHFTICLLDTSKSITPHGMDEEFHVAGSLIDRMHRGDQLTVIPITGNALLDTPGHVLDLAAPLHREPYDHDLAAFRQEAHRQIQAMHDAVIAKPSNLTDIFGALDVAQQEIESATGVEPGSVELIVMSDFLEDDGTWKFVADANLSDPVAARSLAERLAKQQLPWKEPPNVSLVLVESKDLAQASRKRQQAVVMFWRTYLFARLRQPVKVRN